MNDSVKATLERLMNINHRYQYDSEVWPLNEICYATVGILKELIEMDVFADPDYLDEKLATLEKLLEGCKNVKLSDALEKAGVLAI